jgi:E3 ubiquitin-protein ligase BOI and related proteins
VGLTAAAGLGWRQPREQELLGENSQMSSIDFLQTGSAVSTGLALSLEDRRHVGGGAGNSSGDSPLLLLPMLDDDISREVQRLDADMDRFIKAQVTHSSLLVTNITVDALRCPCATVCCVLCVSALNQVM